MYKKKHQKMLKTFSIIIMSTVEKNHVVPRKTHLKLETRNRNDDFFMVFSSMCI